MRALLVALIVAATTLFVVGVSIERGNEQTHHAEAGEIAPEPANGEEGAHTEGAAAEASGEEELRPLGIDVEAWPFVAIAALVSLALAAAAWLRPREVPVLAVVALAMLAFALLDVREVVHQADIGETGLAVLASAVAVLHLAAAAIAGRMALGNRGAGATAGPAGTMPA